MAVDYAIQLPCEVRRKIPEAKLLSMIKHKDRAEFAVEKFKATYPNESLATIVSEYKVAIMVRAAEGISKEMLVTIAQILVLIAPLEEVKDFCKSCPANLSGRSFGCTGIINYPITSDVEEWLLARLPNDAKNPSLMLLFKFLADLEIDGAPVDAHRTRREMFELKAPTVRSWGGWPNKKQVSSSQIIQLLAFSGNISPQQANLYANLLSLASVQTEPPSKSIVVEQLKTFMRAMIVGGKINASVLVNS